MLASSRGHTEIVEMLFNKKLERFADGNFSSF